MVNKCAAFGCKSGYKSHETDSSVTFHRFPNDPELREKWRRANPRKDFVPTEHSRLCSLHFHPSDFVDVRTDKNVARLKKKPEKPLRRQLKEGAVPSVFPNAPSYLSKSPAAGRTTTKAASSSRRADEVRKLAELETSFSSSDDISILSLADVQAKLQAETAVPTGFTYTLVDDSLFVYLLEINTDIPKLAACIAVKSDKTVACSMQDKVIPASQYSDLVDGRMQQLSQLVNLMARLKSWATDSSSSTSLSFYVQTAITVLETALDSLPDRECEEFRKLSFLIEQLRLLLHSKYGRNYSPQLTVFSFLMHAASSAAYNTLLAENVLSLPSKTTLAKITRRLDDDKGLDSSAYLKLRVSKLNEFELNVVLIIDEIYVAKRAKYSAGEVKGLTGDGALASTLLCFMVKSVVAKYKDLVAMYPVSKLTASTQFDCYSEVMAMLRKVCLNVVAISVDNAATNRKFLVDCLCKGDLTTHITELKVSLIRSTQRAPSPRTVGREKMLRYK